MVPATTEIYTLSLHDALPISRRPCRADHTKRRRLRQRLGADASPYLVSRGTARSEEHTSELQSRRDLVCRLLLEKKKRQLNPVPSRSPSPYRHVPSQCYICST